MSIFASEYKFVSEKTYRVRADRMIVLDDGVVLNAPEDSTPGSRIVVRRERYAGRFPHPDIDWFWDPERGRWQRWQRPATTSDAAWALEMESRLKAGERRLLWQRLLRAARVLQGIGSFLLHPVVRPGQGKEASNTARPPEFPECDVPRAHCDRSSSIGQLSTQEPESVVHNKHILLLGDKKSILNRIGNLSEQESRITRNEQAAAPDSFQTCVHSSRTEQNQPYPVQPEK